MLRLYNPQWQYLPFHQNPWFQALCAIGVAIVLGVACVVVGPVAGVGILGGSAAAIIYLKRPELSLLPIMVAMSSVTNGGPSLPGFSAIKMIDAVLGLTVALVILRWIVEYRFKIVATPLNVPLLAFLTIAFFSGLLGFLRSEIALWSFILEFRNWAYYCTFFIVVNFIRQAHQLRLLLKLMLLLALVIGALMVAQYALGNSVVLIQTGRVENLITQDTTYDAVTRILPPGQSTVFVAFLIITVILVMHPFTRSTLFWLMAWFLTAGGVIVTFNRNFWVSGLLIIALTGVLTFRRDPPSFSRVLVITIIGLGALISVPILMPGSAAAGLIQASVERIASISSADKVENDESLRWRDTEYEYAVPVFLNNPILGIGPGAAYRPRDTRLDVDYRADGTKYMHNSHLWVLVKSGVLGYGCLMFTIALSVWRGYRFWWRIPDRTLRSLVLAIALTLICVPIMAIVNPVLMQTYWIPILGIMMGLNEVVYRFHGIGNYSTTHNQR